jgi:hypothetical protein
LLPDLTQVYFFPTAVVVVPALLHLVPALTAAREGVVTRDRAIANTSNKRLRLIPQRYQSAIPN